MTEQNGPQWPLPDEPASAEEPQSIDPPIRPAGERTVVFGAPQLGQRPPAQPPVQQPPQQPPAPPQPAFDANATLLDQGRHAAPHPPAPEPAQAEPPRMWQPFTPEQEPVAPPTWQPQQPPATTSRDPQPYQPQRAYPQEPAAEQDPWGTAPQAQNPHAQNAQAPQPPTYGQSPQGQQAGQQYQGPGQGSPQQSIPSPGDIPLVTRAPDQQEPWQRPADQAAPPAPQWQPPQPAQPAQPQWQQTAAPTEQEPWQAPGAPFAQPTTPAGPSSSAPDHAQFMGTPPPADDQSTQAFPPPEAPSYGQAAPAPAPAAGLGNETRMDISQRDWQSAAANPYAQPPQQAAAPADPDATQAFGTAAAQQQGFGGQPGQPGQQYGQPPGQYGQPQQDQYGGQYGQQGFGGLHGQQYGPPQGQPVQEPAQVKKKGPGMILIWVGLVLLVAAIVVYVAVLR
ncbi:MAG: hypothetical protein ABIS86_22605 [Streptosporangiaceae bacterium]